ncbi:hypothetical protein ACGFIY_21135 [Micromonospora chersina]|uniref:hypothetical protein n=1 Tax=Micromonospora chersina TaxID=47854 RepID=UPI003710856C
MITNDIAAIRADHDTFDQAATDSRRADARPILALGLAGRVPGLCDEIELLRAKLDNQGPCRHTDGPHQSAADCRAVDQRTIQALHDETVVLNNTIRSLNAEVGQLRAERDVVERLVMDTIIATPLPADADQIIAARPALPYRSATVDGLSGVVVDHTDGQVVIDGLTHTPAAALELSAAIARAVRETAAGGVR